ncbi:phasin family protein [Janthinobacterium sp. LB2P10]|uniref:phasin family protein n=1 Tax=Janthinobacterium sp. LB2P10 TaxID=3424194 RepID=UPI003F24200A
MVKKLKELTQDQELMSAVRSSAQQIWQAGLGAYAKAQEEGGRVFSKLVKEGSQFQRRTEDKVGDVSDSVSKLADGVGKQASGSWDKLEQVFEERVARALATIGVPTQNDIVALHAKIDALSSQVAALTGKAAPAPKSKLVPKPAVKGAPKAIPKAAPKAAVARAPAKLAAVAAPRAAAKSTSKPTSKPVSKPVATAAAKKKTAPA